MYKNIDLLNKFDYWSKVTAFLRHEPTPGHRIDFTYDKDREDLVDDLGVIHSTPSILSGFVNKETDVLLHQGDSHRQRSGEFKGQMLGLGYTRHLVVPHTCGLAPYDVYASTSMLDKMDGNYHITDIVKKSFFDIFSSTKFDEDDSFYDLVTNTRVSLKKFREKFLFHVNNGDTVISDVWEPAIYWLNKVPRVKVRDQKSILVAINWCSIRNQLYTEFVLDQLKDAVKGGYKITLRLHSYDQGTRSFFEGIEGIEFEDPSMSKYDSMDSYGVYIVDQTGFGLETAYRSWGEARIFHMKTLCNHDEFGGLEKMGVEPTRTLSQFLQNPEIDSNYPEWVLSSVFPEDSRSDSLVKVHFDELLRIANL